SGLGVVILCGAPEIVPHHETVFVGELVEDLLGVLADPVADHVQVGFLMETEVGLEMRAADALARVIHSPVAATHRDAHTVDLDHEIGESILTAYRADSGSVLRGGVN